MGTVMLEAIAFGWGYGTHILTGFNIFHFFFFSDLATCFMN